MGFINVNVLVAILYDSFAKCDHCGKLGKIWKGFLLFLTTGYEFTVISIKISIKKPWEYAASSN